MIAYPTAVVNCFHSTSARYSASLIRAGRVCFTCIDKGLTQIAIAGHQLPYCDLCDEWATHSFNGMSTFVIPFALCPTHLTEDYGVTRDEYLKLVGWT